MPNYSIKYDIVQLFLELDYFFNPSFKGGIGITNALVWNNINSFNYIFASFSF